MTYRAPVEELTSLLGGVLGLDGLLSVWRKTDLDRDTVAAVLREAGNVAETVLAPLNRAGDLNPARLENGVVRMPPGFDEGYRALAEGGWIGITAHPAHGGMGFPRIVAAAVHEMWSGACLALEEGPLLTRGQIVALEAHASEDIRDLYLPRLASGRWSGTMNLTEPQAGSDVGALRTRAERADDGSYRITGQKIYITWGDNPFAENVSHLVLARLPAAPSGTGGISLFIVPKLVPGEDGRPGAPNGVRVVSLEHKMGLHGAPTAVMQYEDARGWLVGAENGGMAAMFTMMNDARLSVGMQGVGVAEAARQRALAQALERRQGRTGGPTGVIAEHPDVRRMLATMRVLTQAARATALSCAWALDMAEATGEMSWDARGAFLTPIAKAFGTHTGIEVANEAIQVHGGMGFIEETGVAQYLRDIRVAAIYEGTNGIQAADLVTRKLRDGGDAALQLIDEIERGAEAARARHPDLAEHVWGAAENLRDATEWMLANQGAHRLAGSHPFLMAWGYVLGAHHHLAAASAEGEAGRAALARCYMLRVLPRHLGLLREAVAGNGDLEALSDAALGA